MEALIWLSLFLFLSFFLTHSLTHTYFLLLYTIFTP